MIGKSNEWQLQTAKNKFSEVVNHALAGEPQLVKRHGKAVVYVVSAEAFDNATRSPNSLKQLLSNSPHKDIELVTTRNQKDVGREVDL